MGCTFVPSMLLETHLETLTKKSNSLFTVRNGKIKHVHVLIGISSLLPLLLMLITINVCFIVAFEVSTYLGTPQ